MKLTDFDLSIRERGRGHVARRNFVSPTTELNGAELTLRLGLEPPLSHSRLQFLVLIDALALNSSAASSTFCAHIAINTYIGEFPMLLLLLVLCVWETSGRNPRLSKHDNPIQLSSRVLMLTILRLSSHHG